MINGFFDHYVRGVDNGYETTPPIEFAPTQYFDNVPSADHVRAAAAFPFGATRTRYLCPATPGTVGVLATTPCPSALPALLAAGTGGRPGDEPVGTKLLTDGFAQYFGRPFPDLATPVDVVRFDTTPFTEDTLLAGNPRLVLSVLSDPPTTGAGGPTLPAAAFQVVPKVYDVAPDGTERLITRGVLSEQVGAGAPGVHDSAFDAFTMAWEFPAGHRLRLSLASADVPYLKPNPAAFQVAVLPGSTIDLPGAEQATLTPGAVGPVDPVDPPVVPEAPAAAVLPATGLAVLGAVLLLTRRRRRA